MMNMPFNDALADNDTIKRREWRQSLLNAAATHDCDPVTFREILRVDQAAMAEEKRNAQFSTIIDRLVDRKYFWKATIDLSEVEKDDYSLGKSDALKWMYQMDQPADYITAGFVTARTAAEGVADDDTDVLASIGGMLGDLLEGTGAILTGYHDQSFFYFYLGDLMEVLLDCIYVEGGNKHRDHVAYLNLKYMIAEMQIPNASNLNTPLWINPVCIPISLQYFAEWYNSTVVKKGLTYYPVGVMIRDLIERLITNMLYEVCYGSLLPDETPPRMRTTYHSHCDKVHYKVREDTAAQANNFKFWFDANPHAGFPAHGVKKGKPLFVKNMSFPAATVPAGPQRAVKNYFVVYQSAPPFFREQKAIQQKKIWGDQQVASFIYGLHAKAVSYVNEVEFSKTDSPMLREARYFNNSNGDLSLLSNVYDLKFSISKTKAVTCLYPGQIINFTLKDWGSHVRITRDDNGDGIITASEVLHEGDDSDPHTHGTAANTLGFGGYYIILRVEYSLGIIDSDFKIIISTKFLGTDADVDVRTGPAQETIDIIEADNDGCGVVYDMMVRSLELQDANDDEEQFERTGQSNTTADSDLETTTIGVGTPTAEPNTERVAEGSIEAGGTGAVPRPPAPGAGGFDKKVDDFIEDEVADAERTKGGELSDAELTAAWERGKAAYNDYIATREAEDPHSLGHWGPGGRAP